MRRQGGSAYVGQRLASGPPTTEEVLVHESPKKQRTDFPQNVSVFLKIKTMGVYFYILGYSEFLDLCNYEIHQLLELKIV